MDEFLKNLKAKEKEITVQLEGSPLFRQLESLRSTIAAFESNGGNLNGNLLQGSVTPATAYDAVNFTWRERILFFIRKLGHAGIAEIISGIQEQEQDSYTKAWLDKRVGVTVSQLKKKGELGVKTVNKKRKYFIK